MQLKKIGHRARLGGNNHLSVRKLVRALMKQEIMCSSDAQCNNESSQRRKEFSPNS